MIKKETYHANYSSSDGGPHSELHNSPGHADGESGRYQSGHAVGVTNGSTQQQAALRQMLIKYAYDQSHGVDGTTLAALGKQIMVAAKALAST